MSCSESWEGGGTRGRRRGRQELNNLLCYWLMLHCRHLELIAAFFLPFILICCARPYQGMLNVKCFVFPIASLISPVVLLDLFSGPTFMFRITVCIYVCVSSELSLSVTSELTTCGNEEVRVRRSCPARTELPLPFHVL